MRHPALQPTAPSRIVTSALRIQVMQGCFTFSLASWQLSAVTCIDVTVPLCLVPSRSCRQDTAAGDRQVSIEVWQPDCLLCHTGFQQLQCKALDTPEFAQRLVVYMTGAVLCKFCQDTGLQRELICFPRLKKAYSRPADTPLSCQRPWDRAAE